MKYAEKITLFNGSKREHSFKKILQATNDAEGEKPTPNLSLVALCKGNTGALKGMLIAVVGSTHC